MKIELENGYGNVIVDDTTGKILSILVRNVVEGKFDFHTMASYTNNKDGTHTTMRLSNACSNHAIQQEEDEEELRMRVIMQNGNTGEHYNILQQEENENSVNSSR